MKAVLKLTFASAMLAIVSQPAAAQEPQKTLDAVALAHLYSEKCPDWQVNWMQYTVKIEAAGLSVEKLNDDDVMKKMIEASAKASAATEGKARAEICRFAEAEFGPKGSIAPNILSKGFAVRGMNRLFEWLDGDK